MQLMHIQPPAGTTRGQWLALTAALLGWLFDGFEMGLFPVVARPALNELIGSGANDDSVSFWFSLINASFLIGAATGGVVFGWRSGGRVGGCEGVGVFGESDFRSG